MRDNLDSALRDPALCRGLLARLKNILGDRPLTFMEVCGTHTVSIFQSGLRSILPPSITHLSGPGCPVCVTSDAEAALFIDLAKNPEIIIATFGDLLRVPGPNGQSLKHASASGANVEIVYSPLDALAIAKNNPEKKVVFLGVGFETTAPTTAAAVLTAERENINNFLLLAMHKLVPPALETLLAAEACSIDAFLLPGHVATITGLEPFGFLAEKWRKPSVVGGFEAADILLALCKMAEQLVNGKAVVENAYPRAVNDMGNPRAQALLAEVFETCDAPWRGLGVLPQSGLALRSRYSCFDAQKALGLQLPNVAPIAGCKCGEILKGRLAPPRCPLFGKKCTPQNPVGPCMVSTEGSCAAWFKYDI